MSAVNQAAAGMEFSAGGENKLAERLPGEPATLRLIEIEPNVRNRTLLRLLYA